MRVLCSVVSLAAFFVLSESILPPSKDDLSHISQQGEKYLDQQIENAISGVKEMKAVMEKSGEDHKKFLSTLEKTKQQKEEALGKAKEMERQLEEEQEVCNETVKALWEECKPCLKNTCVRYYSRTCASGAGLVGRQLEEVLNRTSPFSIFINGRHMDTLAHQDRQQTREFQDLEERYAEASHNVDDIFRDSMSVFDRMRAFHHPFMMPFPRSRLQRSPLDDPHFHGFQSMFQPMMDMARDIFGSLGPHMGHDGDLGAFGPAGGNDSVDEDIVITKPFGNGQMTCREIRRNSAGCIELKDECEKCKAIQHVDCSGRRPLEGPLKDQLEGALARADRFTQEYNRQLRRFEEEMFNTSKLLDMFNKQFGWVSTLANNTQNKDGFFQVKAVLSKSESDGAQDGGEAKEGGDTKVSVQLFDSPSMTFTVPGDIPWSDPKFSEVVAQEALDRYKETTVVVK